MKYDILPTRTAFLWIFISTLLISGTTGLGIWIYKWHAKQLAGDDKYIITAIHQQTTAAYPLQSGYLAEFLELSIDSPTYLTTYNLKHAHDRLLQCSHIESALLKKVPPDTICVDYTLREPIGILAEYTNTLIDKDGFAFAYRPFYPALDLPEIILGDPDNRMCWGTPLGGNHLKQALAVLEAFKETCQPCNFKIKRIDVSKADAPSAGQREIILALEEACSENARTCFLRLGIGDYTKTLQHYALLQEYLILNKFFFQSAVIIDLRVPQLAFLSTVL